MFKIVRKKELNAAVTLLEIEAPFIAKKAKAEGLIKHVSFSFHDKPEYMAYIIEKGEGLFESVLMQYNLLDRANEDAMRNAREKGLGTVIMGPVAGGRLAAPSALGDRLLGEKKA